MTVIKGSSVAVMCFCTFSRHDGFLFEVRGAACYWMV
jgi:hypothetical protein